VEVGPNRMYPCLDSFLIFVVAIHEIFADNAKKFPDRECVIETKSSQSNGRSFTYRQINESANQLAHHFLGHGCEVGDVVMIYAHRGLVIVVPYIFLLGASLTASH
jgi:L-2-aminoadipate reductase